MYVFSSDGHERKFRLIVIIIEEKEIEHHQVLYFLSVGIVLLYLLSPELLLTVCYILISILEKYFREKVLMV